MQWRTAFSILLCMVLSLALTVENNPPARGSALAKLRRAADAVDDLLDSPPDVNSFEKDPSCYAENGDCRKAMIQAAALADTIAKAQAQAQPQQGSIGARDAVNDQAVVDQWCDEPGNYCDRLKHQWANLNTHADRIASETVHMQKRDSNADFNDAMLQKCKISGGKCRRANNSFLQSFLARLQHMDPGGGTSGRVAKGNEHVPWGSFGGTPKSCFNVGEPCFKLKRAVDLIQDLSAENVDELPEEQKRSVDPARRALSDLGKVVTAKREEMVKAGVIA